MTEYKNKTKSVKGRSTVYNKIVSKEYLAQVDEDNKELQESFCEYLRSVDRSEKTIEQYNNDLNIFFVWNLRYNKNKPFIELTKRNFIKFQSFCIEKLKWSPKRTKRVKSCLSSLSNYIENMLDDEYPDFRNIVCKIENPTNVPIRDKTVLSDEAVEKLLAYLVATERYERACAVAIGAFSGMRKAEILQMKMSYFDDDHLEFNGALYKTEKIRTKGRGALGKQVPKYIMVSVRPYINLWKQRREELGVDIDDVFVSYNTKTNKWNRRKTIDTWTESFSKIIDEPFYYHALRHYACTKMVKSNLPFEVIREFFQWNSIDMIRVYNDMNMEDEFNKYFGKDGIIIQGKTNPIGLFNKSVKQTNIEEKKRFSDLI